MKLTSKTKLSKISGGKKVSSMKPRDYSSATEKWCETGYVSWGLTKQIPCINYLIAFQFELFLLILLPET